MMLPNRRRGVTLTEVLIAIFIMGLGLMALLSLFPLGAAQMAQALKDQRAAEVAANAACLARQFWREACEDDTRPVDSKFMNAASQPRSRQRFIMAMDDPNLSDANATVQSDLGAPAYRGEDLGPPNPAYAANVMPPIPTRGDGSTTPSYPVFVDPIGWRAKQGTANQWWLPSQGIPGAGGSTRYVPIPRRPLYMRTSQGGFCLVGGSQVPYISPQRIVRFAGLTDDISFNRTGTPDLDGDPSTDDGPSQTRTVERQGRYTWAYMFRRYRNFVRDEVDLTVIVYGARPTDVPAPERAYLAQLSTTQISTSPPQFAVNPKGVILTYAGAKPPIRPGSWVMDATMVDANGRPAPQGLFYRVVNTTDVSATQVELELQTPVPTNPNIATRVFLVLDFVVEVFNKGPLSSVSPPRPY